MTEALFMIAFVMTDKLFIETFSPYKLVILVLFIMEFDNISKLVTDAFVVCNHEAPLIGVFLIYIPTP